jgi:hypothetical protein
MRLAPRKLLNRSLVEIIDNSTSIIRDIEHDARMNKNYRVMWLNGETFDSGRIDQQMYNSFNNRLSAITNDARERDRQMRNIARHGVEEKDGRCRNDK